MGCTFIFFSCGAWNRGCFIGNNASKDGPDNCDFFENFAAFILWFTFVVGIVYLILGLIEFCGAASIPHPTPLIGCCGGGGGGSTGDGASGGGNTAGKKKGGAGGRSNSGSTSGKKKKGTGGKKKKSKKGISNPRSAETEMYG